MVFLPPQQDMLEFPAQELRKYFKMGDHVKVIAGRYEGDTGLIVRVEENFVILFSDLTMHEVFYGGGAQKRAPLPPERGVFWGEKSGETVTSWWFLPPAEGVAAGSAALL